MDAHYDQVMRARQALKAALEAPARLYFAYSTILDRAAFEEWRGQHNYGFFDLPAGQVGEAEDLDLVYDFASRWWGGRVAGLTTAPGSVVWGRVFEVAAVDWPIVEHKEGAITGMCIERQVSVRTDGKVVTATAFTTRPERASTLGPVSLRFIEALARGATSAGLPADWVTKIRSAG